MTDRAATGRRATKLRRREARDEGLVLCVASGVVATSYALGSVVQAAYVYAQVVPSWGSVSVWSRVGANAVAVVTLLVTLVAWQQHRRRRPLNLAVGVVIAALAATGLRAYGQVLLGVYPEFELPNTAVELASGFVVALLSAGIGTATMMARRAIRRRAMAAERDAVDLALAVKALEHEEIRVHRAVAEGLHSSMQQRIVLLVARLDTVVEGGALGARDAATLREVRAGLEEVREQDVRTMSRMLYPDQIDIGLVPAVRSIMRRVPTSVATRLEVDPALRAADDPAVPLLGATERLLAARVVEEGTANALRHGHPANLVVTLGLADATLTVVVEDDGRGFDADAIDRSGTRRLAERLAIAGGSLTLVGTVGEGTRIEAHLPVAELVAPVDPPLPTEPAAESTGV